MYRRRSRYELVFSLLIMIVYLFMWQPALAIVVSVLLIGGYVLITKVREKSIIDNGKRMRREAALYAAKIYLAPYQDIWKNLRLSNKHCSIRLGTDGHSISVKEKVKDLFCSETGFQTPKIDTRAAVFKEGKILLVQENNGKWSLPGGCCDACESVKSNTEKEAREEAGVDVEAVRIIAVQDRKMHNLPVYAYDIIKIFVLCRLIGGEFKPNTETVASGFFSEDNLPQLAEEKNNQAQIKMCFESLRDENWVTLFD